MTLLYEAFIRSVQLRDDKVERFDIYPFSIPAIGDLGTLEIDPKVTLFLGENGSGKSTLIEAIAVAAGFNPEGGTRNFRFSTRGSESGLWRYLRIVKGIRKPQTGYFFRAESFQFLIATHSPILLAYPEALLYELSEIRIRKVQYEETEHFRLTRDFLLNREKFFHELFRE